MITDSTQRVAQCFNKAATSYDQHAHIQRKSCRHLIKHLQDLSVQPQRIIDLGCGTGLSTLMLQQQCQPNTIDAIDIAEALLQVAKQRLSPYNIVVKSGNFNHAQHYKKPYDVIFSNMALQWSSDLNKTLQLIKENLQKKSWFAFSIPLQGTFEQIDCARLHRLPHHHDLLQQLKQLDLQIQYSEQKHWLEQHPHLRSALQSIKAIGANHTNTRQQAIITPLRQALQHNTNPMQLSHYIGFYIVRHAC